MLFERWRQQFFYSCGNLLSLIDDMEREHGLKTHENVLVSGLDRSSAFPLFSMFTFFVFLHVAMMGNHLQSTLIN